MIIIGCAGLARAGKDTFVGIAMDILSKNSILSRQYSFANSLKKEVEPFLKDMCQCDVWTQDSSTKSDLRDFLVWYGTTWWRKRDPQRWIRNVNAEIDADNGKMDVAFVSDVRYLNESQWIHDSGGYVVHIASYKPVVSNEGDLIRKFLEPPNEQERINDPIVKASSDYNMTWEIKGLSPSQSVKDDTLRYETWKALNTCGYFSGGLSI